MYWVIICYKCGQFLLSKNGHKTRQCPYCETKLALNKTRKVAQAKTSREASNLIRVLKKIETMKKKSD